MKKTLGVYVEVPFCASKCTFCNFSSQVAPAGVFDPYTRALEQEIDRLPEIYASAGLVNNPQNGAPLLGLLVDSVYLGGGTPSLLGAQRLSRLVAALRRRFRFARNVEFTLELTPDSAGEEFLTRARGAGVNRLSVGAQSFDDRELAAVGRLHSARDTVETVSRARRAGFQNVNLDLIAGLPHQTEASWLRSLTSIAELRPEHASVYLFEADEKSRLGRAVLQHGAAYHAAAVPDDDFMAWAYDRAREFLAEQGYERYEISNFALPGFESRHNRKYWRLDPYVGLGAGAHSFDGLRRWANETPAEAYQARLSIGGAPVADVRTLSPQEQLEEFFFLGLRQRSGVDLAAAGRRWGEEQISRLEAKIGALVEDGWIERRAHRICMSERGYLVSNEIFQEFIM
ncbi:MAG TPA: radical SAM family heme chaperone HemW [Terriglobia bacterium]|nr:radical SAM family heme chaperone HemW [Terriglobia bacterium]